MNILWILSSPVSVGYDPEMTLTMFKDSLREKGNDPDQFIFHLLKDDYYFVWLALRAME